MKPTNKMIEEAVKQLQLGHVIAYPTEAVYGLGCDPGQLNAVEKLLQVKQRPADKGLILIAANLEQLSPFILPLEDEIAARVIPTWPGFATWLLPAQPTVSPLLRGAHDTLAVRVSSHPLVQTLCLAFGGALISTSANRSGEVPLLNAQDVRTKWGKEVAYVCDSELGGYTKPSTIRDARTGEIVRE